MIDLCGYSDAIKVITLWCAENMKQIVWNPSIWKNKTRLFGIVNIFFTHYLPDSKVHGPNMGPTWVLWAPDGPHVGPWTLLSGLVIQGTIVLTIDPVHPQSSGFSTRRVQASNVTGQFIACLYGWLVLFIHTPFYIKALVVYLNK